MNRPRAALFFGLLGILALVSLAIGSVDHSTISAEHQQVRVVDGDSLVLSGIRIRLAYIDAPELSQTCKPDRKNGSEWSCGLQAKLKLIELIAGRPVECRKIELDRYNRWIANCYAGSISLNKEMRFYGADATGSELVEVCSERAKSVPQVVGGDFDADWQCDHASGFNFHNLHKISSAIKFPAHRRAVINNDSQCWPHTATLCAPNMLGCDLEASFELARLVREHCLPAVFLHWPSQQLIVSNGLKFVPSGLRHWVESSSQIDIESWNFTNVIQYKIDIEVRPVSDRNRAWKLDIRNPDPRALTHIEVALRNTSGAFGPNSGISCSAPQQDCGYCENNRERSSYSMPVLLKERRTTIEIPSTHGEVGHTFFKILIGAAFLFGLHALLKRI